MKRCAWADAHPLLREYHDDEWGNVVHDDKIHFEYILLEVMQGGLSWLTILKKREALKEAFDQFDYIKIANYSESDIDRLLKNEKIIRSRRKIEGIIKNANAFVKIQQEFGSFDKYIWGFVGDKTIRYAEHVNGFPAKNALSDKISKDLKAYGFTYLGSITVYSHLQAAGLINDHASYCYKY